MLSKRELEARHEVVVDQYFKTVNIEGETTAEIARTMILPAAVRYLNELLAAAEQLDELELPAAPDRVPGVSSDGHPRQRPHR